MFFWQLTTAVATTGGLFALWSFWHFLADWVLQSEQTALAKYRCGRHLIEHSITQGFLVSIPWHLLPLAVLSAAVVNRAWPR